MTNLKDTLAGIVSAIIDNPDEITIVEKEDGDHVLLELSVASEDMGKIIGKHGKIARAIRQLMKAAAGVNGKKVTVDIKDEISDAE
ncbi:MAG: KH domain-containing protein [Eubacteriales bacterium]